MTERAVQWRNNLRNQLERDDREGSANEVTTDQCNDVAVAQEGRLKARVLEVYGSPIGPPFSFQATLGLC